jgi:NitT/TauT family transport system ATP-binding protein
MAGIETVPETTMSTTQHPPTIELTDVCKTFSIEGGRTVRAVRGLSMTVQKGEFVCVLGPSGGGKSTVLNMLAGFTDATSGSVCVGGRPVTGPGRDRGVVFQRDTLFLWRRIADNITYGLESRGVPKRERRLVAEKYLRLIGLEGYGRAWPKQLSGGMRRRVAIAAVLANEPEVLLMDEPFTGLDVVRRSALYHVLEDLWTQIGCTVFCITHDVDEALSLADRIVVLVHGDIVYETRVDLPRPRGSAELAGAEGSALRLEILRHLEAVSTDGLD